MNELASPVAERRHHVEHPKAPFLPQHLIGWFAMFWLVALAGFPTYWGKLNDVITNGNAQIATGVMAAAIGGVLAWQAQFRRKDRSLLLGACIVLAGMVVLFGILFALALLGQALS